MPELAPYCSTRECVQLSAAPQATEGKHSAARAGFIYNDLKSCLLLPALVLQVPQASSSPLVGSRPCPANGAPRPSYITCHKLPYSAAIGIEVSLHHTSWTAVSPPPPAGQRRHMGPRPVPSFHAMPACRTLTQCDMECASAMSMTEPKHSDSLLGLRHRGGASAHAAYLTGYAISWHATVWHGGCWRPHDVAASSRARLACRCTLLPHSPSCSALILTLYPQATAAARHLPNHPVALDARHTPLRMALRRLVAAAAPTSVARGLAGKRRRLTAHAAASSRASLACCTVSRLVACRPPTRLFRTACDGTAWGRFAASRGWPLAH